MSRTGFATHELFFWYDQGPGAMFLRRPGSFMQPYTHVESPESKGRIRNMLEASGFIRRLAVLPEAAPADDTALLRVHTPGHLERVAELSAGWGGDSGSGAWVPNGGERILRLTAGTAIDTALAVADGRVDNAYALLRPPGHHAEPDRGMGFCVFNNAAVAARVLRAGRGMARVAILDWDVHHGNGTETVFWDDPAVLTISIHQDGLYPEGRGGLQDRGGAGAEGTNINIPLPAGSGHGAYLACIDEVVAPALRRFRPDFILIACGFDSAMFDPLGRMLCHAGTYREMTARMKRLAGELCGGRLVVLQEGGYGPVYGAYCGLAVAEGLSGEDAGCDDPFAYIANFPDQRLQPHQQAVIAAAAELAATTPAPEPKES